MPMPLADLKCTVNSVCESIRLNLASPGSQPHRSAQLLYSTQLAQFIDHAVWRCRVEFTRIRLFESNHIARELNARRLHSQADSEVWNLLLPRITDRAQHAFNTALAKSPGHQNAVISLELRLIALVAGFQPLGFDPIQLQLQVVRQCAMH